MGQGLGGLENGREHSYIIPASGTVLIDRACMSCDLAWHGMASLLMEDGTITT